MKIVLQYLSSRRVKAYTLLFVLVFPIGYLVGSFGPRVNQEEDFTTQSCTDPDNPPEHVFCKAGDQLQWEGILRGVDEMNQCFMLTNRVLHNHPGEAGIDRDVEYIVTMYGQERLGGKWRPVLTNDRHKRRIICEKGERECHDVTLIQETYVPYSSYRVNVQMPDASSFVGDVKFSFAYIRDNFTLMELCVKYLLIILVVAIIIVFLRSLQRFHLRDWLNEQVWIAWMLFALFLFDDPFFIVSVVSEGWFLPFLATLLQVTFLALVLFFWLLMLESLRMGSDVKQFSFSTFYVPKLLLCGLIWTTSIVLLTYSRLQQVHDPAYASASNYFGSFMSDFYSPAPACKLVGVGPDLPILRALMGILFGVYCFWFGYLVVRGLEDMGNRVGGTRCFKHFLFTTLATLAFITVGIILRHARPDKQDHKAAGFLSYYFLLNAYIIQLACFYRPSPDSFETVYESLVFRRIN